MKYYTKMVIIALTAMVFINCSERVPVGYIGMVQTAQGLTGESLLPGHHTCYFRDVMILIEGKEEVYTEQLSILVADNLNFKFDLKTRSAPLTDNKSINRILKDKGSQVKKREQYQVLNNTVLYKTYIQPEAVAIARTVVSKYQTTEIRENREKIRKTIQDKLVDAIKDSPMRLTLVETDNFDYPDEIENAMKKQKEREIAIETEKREQAIKMLKADNRIKMGQKMKIVRAVEAQAEVAYIKILGAGLSKQYLALKKIEADRTLYERVASGDKVIMDASAAAYMINNGKLK